MAIELNGGSTRPRTLPDAPDDAPAPRSPRTRLGATLTALRARPLLGAPTEPVSPHEPAPPAVEPAPSLHTRRANQVRLGVAAAAGFLGSLTIVVTSPMWWLAPLDAWRFTLPGVPHPGSSVFSGVTFVGGLLLMVLGWIGLISVARRQQPSTAGWRGGLGAVVLVSVLWALPFLVGPPQLSNDAYSYNAQGEMASRNIDPTENGPNALPRNSEFWRGADPIWRDAPAPYGPVAIGTSELVVTLAGHDAATGIWGFRALATLGVIIGGVGVVVIARARGVSPQVAFALGIANPVVLLHLIGGSHNDALMLGLLVAGVASFETGRKVLAVVLITLATAVKLPAVIALAYVAWNWKRGEVTLRDRVMSSAAVAAGSAALLTAMCLIAGVGIGWITALKNTGKIMSTFSVFTKLGFLASDLLGAVGVEAGEDSVVALVRLAGMVVAGGVLLVLLVKSPRLGVPKAVGLGLLAVVLCGPVVWPWYLPAGFALVAASGVTRFRPTMIVLIVASSALVFPTSVSPIDQLSEYQHYLGFGVVLLIAAGCMAAQWLSRWSETRRVRLGIRPLTDDLPVARPAVLEHV